MSDDRHLLDSSATIVSQAVDACTISAGHAEVLVVTMRSKDEHTSVEGTSFSVIF